MIFSNKHIPHPHSLKDFSTTAELGISENLSVNKVKWYVKEIESTEVI